MGFRVALKTRPGKRIIFFQDMELEEAITICQGDIEAGEPSVINIEESEEFTALFRTEREADASACAVILNPKEESRTVEIEAESLTEAIEIAKSDYASSQLEINQELTEELNG